MFARTHQPNRRLLMVAVLAMALASIACGGFLAPEPTATPTPTPTSTPTPTPTSTPTPVPTATPNVQSSIELINNTNITVCEYLIDLSNEPSFGNQLRDGNTIDPFTSFTITAIAYGFYDVIAVDCFGNIILGLYDIELSGGDFTFTLDPTSLAVENLTDTSICFLYARPAGTQEWGQDRLGPDQIIPAGTTATLNLAEGFWDLQVEFCDTGEVLERFNEEVSGTDLVWTLFVDDETGGLN